MRNYIAIAEPSGDSAWWSRFPGLPGVTSAADGPEQIAAQARDALLWRLADGRQTFEYV
jgi:predicted RNase H-like HicB family nuclease